MIVILLFTVCHISLIITDLMVDRVPGHTVDGPHMASQHRDRLVLLDMVDVDLVILGS